MVECTFVDLDNESHREQVEANLSGRDREKHQTKRVRRLKSPRSVKTTPQMTRFRDVQQAIIIAQICVCVVTRSTTAEGQHNDMMMWTNVQNDLRHEMALEMWIVSVHEKSEQL